jgi:hypothetical protein
MPPVSRIRLRVEERQAATPCRYREPTDLPAASRLFPFLRLSTLALAERNGRHPGVGLRDAIIDTGAWISAVETDTWRRFDGLGLIEHLPFASTAPGPALIGGSTSPYQLGRLWLSLHDLQPPAPGRGLVFNWLPAVPVIAQLLLDAACKLPAPILLGLHLGVLDGRRLTREVIAPRPSRLTTDRGSQYAQDWHLETA